MTAPANRGKYSEGKVRDELKAIEAGNMAFTFNRVQDAHAAGGRFTPQAGDFQAFLKDGTTISVDKDGRQHSWPSSRNFIIEVKELKHSFRLPHASYSPDKVARVQKRVLAGSEAIVILYHSEDKVWRLVPFAVFTERTGGSWDLREYEAMPHKVAMLALREFMGVA